MKKRISTRISMRFRGFKINSKFEDPLFINPNEIPKFQGRVDGEGAKVHGCGEGVGQPRW